MRNFAVVTNAFLMCVRCQAFKLRTRPKKDIFIKRKFILFPQTTRIYGISLLGAMWRACKKDKYLFSSLFITHNSANINWWFRNLFIVYNHFTYILIRFYRAYVCVCWENKLKHLHAHAHHHRTHTHTARKS